MCGSFFSAERISLASASFSNARAAVEFAASISARSMSERTICLRKLKTSYATNATEVRSSTTPEVTMNAVTRRRRIVVRLAGI